jgi:hypothetical protein
VAKTLRLFNGRWMPNGHAYVAAYSVADACRVIRECSNNGYGVETELRVYWSHDAWGTAMNGITPERGLWVQFERNKKPVRQMPLVRK